MNVLVLANDWQKEEMMALSARDSIHIEWISTPGEGIFSQSFDACIDLLFDNSAGRIEWLKNLHPSLIIINAVTVRLQDIQENFIRINGWNTFLKRPVIEAAFLNPALKARAEALFSGLGRKTEWVPDITGFITPRVVASIINEAFFALEEQVSTREEIDVAMKTGTNYPYGPFEWSEKIGLRSVCDLLTSLTREQNRYQPCALLKQAVLA